jgi:hypothetical protein
LTKLHKIENERNQSITREVALIQAQQQLKAQHEKLKNEKTETDKLFKTLLQGCADGKKIDPVKAQLSLDKFFPHLPEVKKIDPEKKRGLSK